MSATLDEPKIELSMEAMEAIERSVVQAVVHLMEASVSDLRHTMRIATQATVLTIAASQGKISDTITNANIEHEIEHE